MRTDEYPSGWVDISHPETRGLSDEKYDNGSSQNAVAFDREGDWQPYDPENSIPRWKKAYMQVKAAAYKGYRRSTEVAAWAGEVGAKVAAVVGGSIGEKGKEDAWKGEKVKKE